LRDRYEAHHRVSITDDALVAAAQLADRYISDRFLPDKAIDLIDEAGSRMRIRRMTAPPDLREFDEKIADVRREKESAIDSQDFEKAATLRDTEKQLIAKKDAREKERRARSGSAACSCWRWSPWRCCRCSGAGSRSPTGSPWPRPDPGIRSPCSAPWPDRSAATWR